MKKFPIIALIILLSISGFSQAIVLHKDVNDTVLSKHGPNMRNYFHFYVGIGFIAGEPDSTGSEIISGRSTDFVVGCRYKLRVCNFFAIGYDFSFNSYTYTIKQSVGKITPDNVIHDKEKLNFGNLDLSGYMRFNYGRRGNRIGNFIDIGGYGDWTINANNYTKDRMLNGNIKKITTTHLKYFNPINYGVLARIGFNRYSLYGYYRISDIFKTSYNFPELPRFVVGLQIGLHK